LLILIFRERESQYFAAAEFGQPQHDLRRDVVVPPGRYFARFLIFNQTRGGCPWSMAISYPS
jgi:hypothetical protein